MVNGRPRRASDNYDGVELTVSNEYAKRPAYWYDEKIITYFS